MYDQLLGADEMTWSSEQKEGEKAGAQTEEAAMAAALTRAFRAIDEEVIGSVCSAESYFALACVDWPVLLLWKAVSMTNCNTSQRCGNDMCSVQVKLKGCNLFV